MPEVTSVSVDSDGGRRPGWTGLVSTKYCRTLPDRRRLCRAADRAPIWDRGCDSVVQFGAVIRATISQTGRNAMQVPSLEQTTNLMAKPLGAGHGDVTTADLHRASW